MNRESIVEKIKKLLSLASNNPSENESAVAAHQARKMMDKFQISRMEVEQFDRSEFGTSSHIHNSSAMPKWMSCLALEVGKYNDTVVSMTREYANWTHKKGIVFKGYEADAILATVMFEYLCQAVNHRTARARDEGMVSGRREMNSFRWGASCTLINRLRTIRLERENQMKEVAATGKGLMVMKKEAVYEEFGRQQQSNTRVSTNQHAAEMGNRAGAKISLDPQVTGSSNLQLN